MHRVSQSFEEVKSTRIPLLCTLSFILHPSSSLPLSNSNFNASPSLMHFRPSPGFYCRSIPFYNMVSRACAKSHRVSQSSECLVLRAFPLSALCPYYTLVYASLFTLYRIFTLNWAEQSRRRLRYTIDWVTRFYPISPPRALPKLYKASTQPLLCSILSRDSQNSVEWG